jgi:cysteine desulfurase
MSGGSGSIYLDHAAATPLDAEVAAAMAEAARGGYANPSSQHAAGRAARRVLEDARERILAALGGRGGGGRRDRLVFTSGASEANHLAILGRAAAARPGTILATPRDHASVRHAAAAAARIGWKVAEVGLDAAGRTSAAELAARLAAAGEPAVVALTLVCGQSGAIEDPATLAAAAAAAVHLDATQAVGLLPVDFAALPAGTLALAAHKFGGPRGIGALLVRGDVGLVPPVAGTQEEGLRPGTEAVALAAGFARAVELAVARRATDAPRIAALRDRFEAAIVPAAAAAGIAAEIIAAGCDRAPHISTVAFRGVDRQALALAADLAGVCLATGTACTSGSSEPSPALLAMGLPEDLVQSAVRLSFGRETTQSDIDETIARLAAILARRGDRHA